MDKHPMTASTVRIRLPSAQHAVPLLWASGTSLALQPLLAQAQCPQAWEPPGLQAWLTWTLHWDSKGLCELISGIPCARDSSPKARSVQCQRLAFASSAITREAHVSTDCPRASSLSQGTYLVDIGVPHFGEEPEGRRRVGVVDGKAETSL